MYFEEITKSDETHPKVENFESLSEDLSNNYQCCRVPITSKNVIILFSDFGDRSRPSYLKGFKK
jgi:hypothetical protein